MCDAGTVENTRTNAMTTEESFIDFKCPYCGEPVSFPQANAKSLQACPSCMEALIVPETTSEVGRKIPIPITTARLVLRRLCANDWRGLVELDSEDLSIPLRRRGNEDDEQAIIQWLEHDNSVKLTTPDESFYLGIEVQDGNKLIGLAQLAFSDARLQAAINIQVSPRHRRNGVATETGLALLELCFKHLALHRVTAWCESQDIAARGLCQKVGLRCEGEFLKDRQGIDGWLDTTYYAVLGEEYRCTGDAG